jgi:uncharacterized membrane protein required for colicin V production
MEIHGALTMIHFAGIQAITPDKIPFNFFDMVVFAFLVAGILSGRKHGMSEELLILLKWVVVVFGCSKIYGPLGEMMKGATHIFGLLTCYLVAYLVAVMLLLMLFSGLKRVVGGKIAERKLFGGAEFYLGMTSGLVRYACIVVVGMALLNARLYTYAEVRDMNRYQQEAFNQSDFFPTFYTFQSTVFQSSFAGYWVKKHLGFLLIRPTQAEHMQRRWDKKILS